MKSPGLVDDGSENTVTDVSLGSVTPPDKGYRRMFDAPIPGQSLTTPPGAAPYERPPQFTKPDEAAEYVFDKMTSPKNAIKLQTALENGATVESIVNTTLFAGFREGKWTPDVAAIIAKPVLYQVTAIAKKLGVENFQIFNPDTETAKFVAQYGKPKQDTTTTSPEAEKLMQDAIVDKAKQNQSIQGNPDRQTGDKVKFGGLFGELGN
jgi:hypothetical protein